MSGVQSLVAEPAGERRLPRLLVDMVFLGLTGLGGNLQPRVRYLVVVKRRWLDEEEFAELLTLASLLPGGNRSATSLDALPADCGYCRLLPSR